MRAVGHARTVAELIVVSGPPGAGKSTVAARVTAAYETAVLVPGDTFFGFWARGAIDPWLPEAHHQNELVLAAAAAAAGAFASGGCTVVYDGVLGPWFLPHFATASGVDRFHYAILLPPVETCLARIATRSGHGFDDPEAARRMHAEFSRAAVDERHILRDADEDPGASAEAVRQRLAAGQLLFLAEQAS